MFLCVRAQQEQRNDCMKLQVASASESGPHSLGAMRRFHINNMQDASILFFGQVYQPSEPTISNSPSQSCTVGISTRAFPFFA